MTYTPDMLKQIRLSLKKGNQRIAALSKKFGADSEVVKNQTGFLRYNKGSSQNFKKYAGTSESGNIKVDIPKVIAAIKSGKLNDSEISLLLTKMTGERFNKEGELIKKENYDGIDTVTSLKRKTEEAGLSESEWEDYTITKAEVVNSFQEEYSDYWENTTLYDRMELTPELYADGKRTWDEYNALIEKMHEINEQNRLLMQQSNAKLQEGE